MRRLRYRKSEGKRLGAGRHALKVERVKMPIKKGDLVRVVRGADRGTSDSPKEGRVLRVFTKTGRITVEGVNMVKRHRKAKRAEEQSAIVDMPAPIHHSNVMLLDPKSGLPTRTKYRLDADGTKERISAKSGEAIPRSR